MEQEKTSPEPEINQLVEVNPDTYNRRGSAAPDLAKRQDYQEYLDWKCIQEQDLDTLPSEEIERIFIDLTNNVQNQEPLINLLLWKEKEFNNYKEAIEQQQIFTSTIKLTSPTLKFCNDHLLGIIETDEFLSCFHSALKRLMKTEDTRPIGQFFKGAHVLLLDMDEKNRSRLSQKVQNFQTDTGSNSAIDHYLSLYETIEASLDQNKYLTPEEIALIEETLNNDQLRQIKHQENNAALILKQCCLEQYLYLIKDRQEKSKAFDEIPEESLSSKQQYEKTTLEKQIQHISDNIHNLKDKFEDSSINLSFGISPLRKKTGKDLSIRDLSLALHLAEAGANISSQRFYEDIDPEIKKQRELINQFNPLYFYMDLIRMYCELLEKIQSPEYSKVCKLFFSNPENENLPEMKAKMIGKVRKLNKFQSSQEYDELKAEYDKFEEVLDFFKKFYKVINRIDIVKNYTQDEMNNPSETNYAEKITRIKNIILQFEKTQDENEKKLLLIKLRNESIRPLKGIEVESGVTEIEQIRRDTKGRMFLKVFADIKGLGIDVMKELEESSQNLLSLVKKHSPILEEIFNSKEGSLESIKMLKNNYGLLKQTTMQALSNLAKENSSVKEFNNTILKAGDKVTTHCSNLRNSFLTEIPEKTSMFFNEAQLLVKDETVHARFTIDCSEKIEGSILPALGDEIEASFNNADTFSDTVDGNNSQLYSQEVNLNSNSFTILSLEDFEQTIHQLLDWLCEKHVLRACAIISDVANPDKALMDYIKKFSEEQINYIKSQETGSPDDPRVQVHFLRKILKK